jgi:iron complex outermembrane receptor protein
LHRGSTASLGRIALAWLTALCGAVPATVAAQSPPAQPCESNTTAACPPLDSVTVLGKRQQRRRDVAAMVDRIEGRTLEARDARDQEDLFKLTPAVQFNKGQPNQALPTIRGIGTAGNTDLLGTQQATTGFYVDDVPFTDPFGFVGNADIAPFDLSRVELLRGPQGVLYGSASLGGAINYVLNKPDLAGLHSSVLGSISSVSNGGPGHAVYAMLNAPVKIDVAGIRAVVFDRRDSGYITNLGTGRARANELHQRGGRIIGAVEPMRGVQVSGMLLTQRTDNDDSFAVSPDPEQLTVSTPTASTRRNEFTLRTLQLDLALGGGHHLTSISAVLDKRAAYVTDTTRSDQALGGYYGPLLGLGRLPALPQATSLSARPLWSHAVSQEVRVASAGDDALNYVAGALAQRTRFDWRGISMAPGGQALWGAAGALLPNDLIGAIDVQARTTETAVFADGDYRWANGLSLGLGGRAYRTTLAYEADVTFLGRSAPVLAENAEHGFTPKLSLKYRFDEHLVYLLASKGYRFGGVNLNPPQMSAYRSDSVWNHEAGLRLVPGPTLRLDLSTFVVDWKDAQVSTLLAGPVPFIGVANVGQARSRGFEAALNWQALRDVEIAAGLAYTDARTTAAFTASSGALVASGARLPGTARWQSTLQLGYAFAGPAASQGSVTATHSHVGPRVFDIEGRSKAAGYALFDLRLAFVSGPWALSAGVNNLLDSRGVGGASAVYRPGLVSYVDYYVVKPRTVVLSLRHDH